MLKTNRFIRRTFNFYEKMEAVQYTGKVALKPVEEKLFDIFRKAAVASGKPVVLRVAGGWVRDKVDRFY